MLPWPVFMGPGLRRGDRREQQFFPAGGRNLSAGLDIQHPEEACAASRLEGRLAEGPGLMPAPPCVLRDGPSGLLSMLRMEVLQGYPQGEVRQSAR